MSGWLAVVGRVGVRALTLEDRRDYLARTRASVALHGPWVSRPCTAAAFAEYLERSSRGEFNAYLLVRRKDGALVGEASLSRIVEGSGPSAWIAFNAFVPHDGQGLMTDGLRAVLDHAFGALGLHRVEVEVQPANQRSLALLARLGFQFERHLPRHRRIGGRWYDYERWAIAADAASTAPAGS